MPKGGKGKNQKTKEPSYKEYKLISLEEMHAREIKYTNRLLDLRACLNFVDDAVIEVGELNEKQRLLDKWNDYVSCDGLPKPYIPPDIRLLFVKMKFFEDEDVEETVDWLLSVDERSILTQDYEKKDKTRRTLVKEICPNFGLLYDKNVDTALKVYKKMEYYLDDDIMVAKAPPRILLDIIETKHQVQQEIRKLFDRYCYRILAGEDSYMHSIDPITADFHFKGNNFEMHIWTLKDVPILFEFIDDPAMCADFHQLKVKLEIPHSMLEDNLTIRGLHMSFDHFSSNAKSYEQEINVPTDNLNAGIPDLHECLINEWNMQIDIQTNVRNTMIQRRADWEDKMKFIEEEQKLQEKNRRNQENTRKSKVLKPPREVPLITADTYPDIFDDFLDKERLDFENFINVVYHPSVLKLTPHEVNLKRFFILGGIYQFDAVIKPIHYKFNYNKFTMTWHQNDAILQIRDDFRTKNERKTARSRKSTLQMSLASLNRLSRLPSQMIMDKQRRTVQSVYSTMSFEPIVAEAHTFVLSFELPPHLCLWGGQPIACQFEDNVVGFQDVPPPPPKPATPPATPKTPQLKTETSTTTIVPTDSAMQLPPFGLQKMESNSRLSTANVFRTSLSVASLAAVRMRRPNLIDMEDFVLNYVLNKTEIRNLQRYCVPRILSSFKFPRELKEEQTEDSKNKPKGMGGTLLRRRDSEEDVDLESGHLFSYHRQNNPERMFPIFPAAELPNIPFYTPHVRSLCDDEPDTFRDLLDILHTIKHRYKKKHEATKNIEFFHSRTNMRLLRLKTGFHVPDLVGERKTSMPGSSMRESVYRTKSSTDVNAGPTTHLSIMEMSKYSMDKDQGAKERSLSITPSMTRSRVRMSRVKSQERSRRSSSTIDEDRPTYKYAHWTTEYITKTHFDKETSRLTVWTDRLGTFGFAFKRYEHFPFKYWSVAPSEENPDTEIVFTLETQFVKCVLYVTGDGYRGYVTEPTKKFVRNRAMYLVIEEPIKDFKELKRLFKEKHLNIFSDHDARFYIENGYFSEKHLAAELHTYSCMAINSTLMRFEFSDWNRLAQRRDIILRFGIAKDPDENLNLVRITPEEATFVEIQELCSDDLNIIKLNYTLTWRNIDFYADLNHLIISIYPTAPEMHIKDPYLICSLKNLLCEIRPLSYS